MPNENGWPDASNPGVPMTPERDGWHWLQCGDDAPEAYGWINGHWVGSGDGVPLVHNPCWRYLGPCLTPAEVEHHTRAAAAAAWLAAREAYAPLIAACIADFGNDPTDDGAVGAGPDGDMAVTFAIIRAARDAAPPADAAAALAEVVERAREEGFRAGWRVNAIPADSPDTSPEYLQGCEDVDWKEYSNAIRARGEGGE